MQLPPEVGQVVQSGQIAAILDRARIITVTRVVNHSHVSHPALGLRATRSLLTHTGRVNTDVRAAALLGIAGPSPRFRRLKSDVPVEHPPQSRAGFFGRAADVGLTQTHARKLSERLASSLSETAYTLRGDE